MPSPHVSLVIATFNRGAEVVRALEAVLAQPTDVAFEVVVVDQTPIQPAGLLARLREICGDPRVTYLRAAPASLPGARNLGAQRSSGEVIVFVDDDVLPDEGFLDAHWTVHCRYPEVAGVGGRARTADVRPPAPLFWMDRWGRNIGDFDQPVAAVGIMTTRGANMSFKRSWFDAVGGFDARFSGNAYREESDFCFRIRDAGGTLRYDPAPSVLHLEAADGGCRESSEIHDRAMAYQNEFLFLRKHWPTRRLPLLLVVNFFSYVLTGYTVRQRLVRKRAVAWLRGVVAGIMVARRPQPPALTVLAESP